MAQQHLEIGVVILKRKLNNPYVDFSWRPFSILPAAPQTAVNTSLGFVGEGELFFAGAHELSLFVGETAHYRDNLISDTPSIWVALRVDMAGLPEVYLTTLDPYEGEALATNNLDDIIEKLPMPAQIAHEVAVFVDTHHVEQVFVKRQRNKFKTGENRFEGKLDA